MRWLRVAVVGIVAVVAIVVVGGLLLPVAHVASVRAQLPASPDTIYALIRDVKRAPSWRTDVDTVVILSGAGEPLRWEERGRFGAIRFVREEERPPTRLVSRIDGRDQGFGGRWTWSLEAAPAGSRVTVREDGEVYNPVFRFLARFVFGHHATMETYLRDLGRHFGADPEMERVEA